MTRLPILLFWLLMASFVSYVVSSVSTLPEQIATHFGGGGVPNGWMTHNGYQTFILAFGLGLPFFIIGFHYPLARYTGNQFNIPNRESWLAPEQRAETLGFMLRHSWWLGCLLLSFMIAIHHLLLISNLTSPPRLSAVPFLLFLTTFLVALCGWILLFVTRFRKKP